MDATGPERQLIVTCDDLGVSHAVNAAILDCLTRGFATDASLMVPCPWAWEAAQQLRDFPVGVHLTLTSEYADYRWRGLTQGASLHDSNGFLHRTAKAALEVIDTREAHAECQAQVERALAWGVDITHLDAHMDIMLSRPDLFVVYLDLAEVYRLPVRVYGADRMTAAGPQARERAAARGLRFNHHSLDPWGQDTRALLEKALPQLQSGVTEIYTHPALDGDELRAYDKTNIAIRLRDYACLTDPTLGPLLKRHGIGQTSFRALRDAQRAERP